MKLNHSDTLWEYGISQEIPIYSESVTKSIRHVLDTDSPFPYLLSQKFTYMSLKTNVNNSGVILKLFLKGSPTHSFFGTL